MAFPWFYHQNTLAALVGDSGRQYLEKVIPVLEEAYLDDAPPDADMLAVTVPAVITENGLTGEIVSRGDITAFIRKTAKGAWSIPSVYDGVLHDAPKLYNMIATFAHVAYPWRPGMRTARTEGYQPVYGTALALRQPPSSQDPYEPRISGEYVLWEARPGENVRDNSHHGTGLWEIARYEKRIFTSERDGRVLDVEHTLVPAKGKEIETLEAGLIYQIRPEWQLGAAEQYPVGLRDAFNILFMKIARLAKLNETAITRRNVLPYTPKESGEMVRLRLPRTRAKKGETGFMLGRALRAADTWEIELSGPCPDPMGHCIILELISVNRKHGRELHQSMARRLFHNKQHAGKIYSGHLLAVTLGVACRKALRPASRGRDEPEET